MLNVNALQKTLSAMSLPEIQKYAQLHKNDPYVVAMALSVANTKKEAQTAQQGMAGMQPMPKVAEQDIAGIAPAPAMGAAQLPENVGIGQLPAQNMQGMAGGGIVAFDDGGEVSESTYGEQMAQLGEFLNPVRRFRQLVGDPSLRAQEEAAAARKPDTVTQPAALSTAGAGRGSYAGYNPLEAAANVNNKPLPRIAPEQKLPPAPAPTGTPNMSGAGLGGFMDYLKANKPAAPEDMEAFMKRRSDYMGENPSKKQMERLDKQEVQALADREEAKSMAIIKAGLGMLGGTSRYAMENIGKGAMGGLEDYITSQKDAKKLAAERDKMRDAVENAAYAYKKGDMDAYEKYAQDAKNAQNVYAAHGLSALGAVTGAQIHAGATAAAANAMPANMRAAMLLGEGKTQREQLESGLAKLNAIGAEKTDLTFAKMYADHVNKAQSAMQQPMTPTQFATTIRSALSAYKPKVVDTDKPSATVYDR